MVNTGALVTIWQEWQRGILPHPGGWLAQPLYLINIVQALELTHKTFSYLALEKSDWSLLTETQRELVRWIGG